MKNTALIRSTPLVIVPAMMLCAGRHASAERMPAYVQFGEDPKTEVCVSWHSTTDGTPAELSYGATPAQEQTASSRVSGTVTGYMHHVTLTDLTPGTVYYYDDGGVPASFKTAPASPEPFNFCILSDVQEMDFEIVESLQKWADYHADSTRPDFWVNTGDCVQAEGRGNLTADMTRWDLVFKSAAKLCRQAVFMPTLGNCETYEKTLAPELYMDLFVLPDNGDPDFRGWWYAYEYGDALMVHLCCHPHVSREMLELQTTFLRKVLSSSRAKWRFVFLHAPRADISDPPDDWTPLYEKYAVNAVFNGHGHHFTQKTENGVLYMMFTKINRTGRTIKLPVIRVGSESVVVDVLRTGWVSDEFGGWDGIRPWMKIELKPRDTSASGIY